MKNNQLYKHDLLWNYKPSVKTNELVLFISKELEEMDLKLLEVFKDCPQDLNFFLPIEIKYALRTEGIYTTLPCIVNITSQDNLQDTIKIMNAELPKLNNDLIKKWLVTTAKNMNHDIDESKRWSKDFGIYHPRYHTRYYEPPINKEQVNGLLKMVTNKMENDKTITELLHSHILFEKVHPFVESNGRLGRLVLQKQLHKIMKFNNVIPLSWGFARYIGDYYSAFNIFENNDIDLGIQKLLEIILKLCKKIKKLLIDLKELLIDGCNTINGVCKKSNSALINDVIFSLQIKSTYLQKKYKLNTDDIDQIFNALGKKGISFNQKIIENDILYWNEKIEEVINNNLER